MNYFSSLKSWQYILACTIVLISGITAAQAQMPAGPDRPATVPEGYVITPMGYFHASCVLELAEGDVMHPDEKAIQHKDGSFDSMPTCAYPHFTPDGEKVADDGGIPENAGLALADADDETGPPASIGHQWVEALYLEGDSTFAKLSAAWTVPPEPVAHDNEVIFFFPGLEDYTVGSKTTILQPVLGWNAQPQFKNSWSLASWNCCFNGVSVFSTPIATAAGHQNFGAMQFTCPAGTRRCGSWHIVSTDVTTGKSTILPSTSSNGFSFNWAFPGVLEVYKVKQCSDYPGGSSGTTQFSEIRLLDYNFNVVDPHWVLWKLWPKLTPQCGYAASGTGSEVTLKY
jgi:hypothetical protein